MFVNSFKAGLMSTLATNSGKLPLHCASSSNELDIVKLLISANAKVNARAKKRFTPLHTAIRFGHVKVAEELLNSGAGIERETIRNMTPLILSCHFNQPFCAELLVGRGANVGATDMFGRTSLHWAIKRDNEEIFQLLLDHEADISAADDFDKTPVIQAAKSNRPEMLQRLLGLGAERNSVDRFSRSALHVAAERGHLQCITLLLANGFSANIAVKSEDFQHNLCTPLMLSAEKHQLGAVQLLLEGGADPNSQNGYGMTALCMVVNRFADDVIAKEKSGYSVALTLLQANADSNLVPDNPFVVVPASYSIRTNAMDRAFCNGYRNISMLLAKAGCRPLAIKRYFPLETQNLPTRIQNDVSLLDWFRVYFRSPRPLKELARFSFRSHMPAQFFKRSLESMNLPPGIHSYVMFNELCDDSEVIYGSMEELEDHQSDTEKEMQAVIFDSDFYGDEQPFDSDIDNN